MTSYDNWKLASPDDVQDALDREDQAEAAGEIDADRFYDEHGQDWLK